MGRPSVWAAEESETMGRPSVWAAEEGETTAKRFRLPTNLEGVAAVGMSNEEKNQFAQKVSEFPDFQTPAQSLPPVPSRGRPKSIEK